MKEAWLDSSSRMMIETSRQATETARRILDLQERHRQAITAHFGRVAGHALQVLETLDKHPIISVPEIRKLTGTTYPAANDLMSRFEKHGILREITGQTRNRRFRYDDYVHLFDAD